MKLSAPATLFASLYDGNPKVIAVRRLEEADTGSLPLHTLCLIRHDGGYLLCPPDLDVIDESVPLRPLAVPPANVWCLWARDEAAKADAERMLEWWTEAGGAGSEPVLRMGSTVEIQRALLGWALNEIGGLHRRNQDLQRNLSTLREEWGQGTRLPPEAVELLDNLRLSPPRLVFATPRPAGAMPVLLRHGRGGAVEIVQRLPLWARGMVGIDLHVDSAPKGGGFFAAALHAVDSGRMLAEWRVPFHAVREGWLSLRLPAASERMDRVLELRIGAVGVVTGPPRLSLSPAGLLDEFAVAPTARAGGGAGMLTMRLWGGIPGVDYGPASHLAAHPLPARLVWPLTESVLAQVRKSRDHKATFPWFGLLRNGRILLHPLYGATAAACIPLDDVPGVVAVRGHAVIEDPRCRTPIACKLVVAPPSVTVDEAEREEGVLASSGWVVLDQPRQALGLAAALTAPWQGPMVVHLFTAIPDHSYGLYGRTVFFDFEVEIDAGTAWAAHTSSTGGVVQIRDSERTEATGKP